MNSNVDRKGLLEYHEALVRRLQEVIILGVEERHVEVTGMQVQWVFRQGEDEGLVGHVDQVLSLQDISLPEG